MRSNDLCGVRAGVGESRDRCKTEAFKLLGYKPDCPLRGDGIRWENDPLLDLGGNVPELNVPSTS